MSLSLLGCTPYSPRPLRPRPLGPGPGLLFTPISRGFPRPESGFRDHWVSPGTLRLHRHLPPRVSSDGPVVITPSQDRGRVCICREVLDESPVTPARRRGAGPVDTTRVVPSTGASRAGTWEVSDNRRTLGVTENVRSPLKLPVSPGQRYLCG